VAEYDDIKPTHFAVCDDGSSEAKREWCAQKGIEYIVFERVPAAGMPERSSTDIKARILNDPNLVRKKPEN
jgi:hypothetical protein